MSALTEFFSMGGYALYVWTSYAAAFILIGGIVLWSRHELKATRQRVFVRARRSERKR